MSFAPKANKPALLAGIYIVNGIIPIVIILYQWIMAMVAGHTERVIASALIAEAKALGIL